MKKSLIIIATAALVFAGCTENDTFRKDINGNGANNGAITFNSFTEKVTKAENSNARYTQAFYTHQESFQVWARKSNQPKQEIFGGTKVVVAPGSTANTYTYEYAPERFWDKLAEKYHFYAAAPARPASETEWSWKFNEAGIQNEETINAGYFSIDKDFTLNEVNLKHADNDGADHALENVFKGIKVSNANDATDVDLLIAAPTEVTNSYYNVANPNAVNLNFIHILSKLNVTIKTSLGTVTPTDGSADHTYQVKLLAFEVKNVPNVGKFNENPNELATNGKKQIRWTLTDPTAPATNKTSILTGIEGLNGQGQIKDDALAVPYNPTEAQKLYIVESLFMPQHINYERVALDAKHHNAIEAVAAVPFSSFAEYTAANRTRLTETQFNQLVVNGAFVTYADYKAIEGNESTTQAQYDELIKDVTKIPAIEAIDEYDLPSEPYFTIKYSIDNEIFEANYNLAAAFLGYNNNSQKWDADEKKYVALETADPTTFDFYEGWQNTLNITIHPTAITFTADVAEWADNADVDYTIDNGNENPNN